MITSDGLVFGLILAFLVLVVRVGYFRFRGYKVRILYIRRTDKVFTLGVILVSALALVTVVTTSRNQSAGEDCARQFRNALTYNAQVNREDRAYDDQSRGLMERKDDELRDRRIALDTLIVGLGPDPVLLTPDALERYNAIAQRVEREVVEIDDQLDDVKARKDHLAQTRAAYPDPTCGR